ncbi:hypothetical protein M427DRAFT_257850 [Gonapodya prolifera JEL478]|uniref:Uncharacterized protein n=1 Tax=Gonapodya prolifera (strain JEL478) TaxID=1344416 RepID=A0A138ZX66_GONPJ|nr:hypothetical protein M427DRAFT_257850 [Gonapodya prolifera JEL478]|eukprot:KXS09054.1 hypothetical protein M427DRAFT_257850 [Gonapodya prolifera JEL478]
MCVQTRDRMESGVCDLLRDQRSAHRLPLGYHSQREPTVCLQVGVDGHRRDGTMLFAKLFLGHRSGVYVRSRHILGCFRFGMRPASAVNMDANTSITTTPAESKATLIGGALGGAFGVVCVIAGAFLYLRRKRARQSKNDHEQRQTLPIAPPSRSSSPSPPQYSFVVARKLTRLFSKSSFDPSTQKPSRNRDNFPSLQSSLSTDFPSSTLPTTRAVLPPDAMTLLDLPPRPSHVSLPSSTQANVGTVVVPNESFKSPVLTPHIEMDTQSGSIGSQTLPNWTHVESSNPRVNHASLQTWSVRND